MDQNIKEIFDIENLIFSLTKHVEKIFSSLELEEKYKIMDDLRNLKEELENIAKEIESLE